MSANRGSCDLTLVDPSTLLASVFAAQYNTRSTCRSRPGNGLQRIVPPAANGTPLGAAPYEAVFLPQDTRGWRAARTSVRATAPRRPTPWRRWSRSRRATSSRWSICRRATSSRSVRRERLSRRSDAARDHRDRASCRARLRRRGRAPDAGATAAEPPRRVGRRRPTGRRRRPDGGASTTAPPPRRRPRSALTVRRRSPSRRAAITPTCRSRTRAGDPVASALTPSTLTPAARTSRWTTTRMGATGSASASIPTAPTPMPADVPGHVRRRRARNRALPLRHRARRLAAHRRRVRPGRRAGVRDELRSARSAERSGRCRSTSTPASAASRTATVKRRPYSTRQPRASASRPCRSTSRPPNLSGRRRREDTVNGGYAWVLTAIGHDLPRQHRSGSADDQGGRAQGPDGAVRSDRSDAPTSRSSTRTDPIAGPNGWCRNRRRSRTGRAIATSSATRASLDPALGPGAPRPAAAGARRPVRTSSRSGRRGRRTTPPRSTRGPADLRVLPRSRRPPSRRAGTSPGKGRSSARATRASSERQRRCKDGGGGFCTDGRAARRHRHAERLHRPMRNVRWAWSATANQRSIRCPGGFTVTGLCVERNLRRPTRRRARRTSARCAATRSPSARDSAADAGAAPRRGRPFQPHAVPDRRRRASAARRARAAPAARRRSRDGRHGRRGGHGRHAAARAARRRRAAAAAPVERRRCRDRRNDCFDPTDGSTAHFQCVGTTGETRCLNPCAQDQDCRPGRVCLPTLHEARRLPAGSTCAHGRPVLHDVAVQHRASCEPGVRPDDMPRRDRMRTGLRSQRRERRAASDGKRCAVETELLRGRPAARRGRAASRSSRRTR